MIKTFSFRAQLLGDLFSSLGILTAIEKKYPGAHHVIGIAKKCKVAAQFLQGHPLIPEILISSDDEGNIFEYEGITFDQRTEKHPAFTYQVNINPQVVDNQWYNSMGIVRQNFKMCFGGEEEYNSLTEEELRPKLYRDFPIVNFSDWGRQKPIICFQAICAYGIDQHRSPDKEFWNNLIDSLKHKYNFVQCGHEKDYIVEKAGNICFRDFKDQIAMILGASLFIGLENGLTTLVRSYNEIPSLCLHTNWATNHHTNFEAWLTKSPTKENINVFAPNGMKNLDMEKVKNSIDLLLK